MDMTQNSPIFIPVNLPFGLFIKCDWQILLSKQFIMENTDSKKQNLKETFKRSLVKTISYRLFIILLDFTTIYLITHKVNLAIGFMLVSNIYTTVAYFLHERIWDRIKWGKEISVN